MKLLSWFWAYNVCLRTTLKIVTMKISLYTVCMWYQIVVHCEPCSHTDFHTEHQGNFQHRTSYFQTCCSQWLVHARREGRRNGRAKRLFFVRLYIILYLQFQWIFLVTWRAHFTVVYWTVVRLQVTPGTALGTLQSMLVWGYLTSVMTVAAPFPSSTLPLRKETNSSPPSILI